MRLIAVGRMRDGPEAALFTRYADRLRPKLSLTELPEAQGSVGEIRRRDSVALVRAVPERAWVVALDLGGEMLDSAGLAASLDRWLASSRPVCFLIGGAEGFDGTVVERSDFLLSLGRLTWPHLLVRGMLAEQLYRARAIASGHPYHREGRP